MNSISQNLWLIPVLPLLAALGSSVIVKRRRKLAASLAIGSMILAFVLSTMAFVATLGHEGFREVHNFTWFQIGESSMQLGWVLDPLTACMLVMVTFVGTLIFIFSIGYMAHDDNFTRFFCFLSLFAAAMLGIVIANNLLLLFMSWELVGLASYLLIGFWYHKPSAAAAAKKAFITTRIGDIGLFLGILWLYKNSGTLLFYDHGNGCLEHSAVAKMVAQTTLGGMAVSTAISLLIFCGAVGKSGQVPLHVWLPDAMEGPTPVSALIHAATMVAAGVFLVARVYPLMSNGLGGHHGAPDTAALQVVTWIGAITAVFAASIAVAQTDIKRVLAYSTVSQLGYMMMGLGVGGVAVGMFHLITHAFFKALLFLGAGSVIHGCHEEQDIRHMGGIRKFMPITFWTYAIGTAALAGVIPFAGFWSKDEILHSAWDWHASMIPFALGLFGALLTAFYMTRQVCFVFFGTYRGGSHDDGHAHSGDHTAAHQDDHPAAHGDPHESPPVMVWPLMILAVFAALLGFVGTPLWPAFSGYLEGAHPHAEGGESPWGLMLVSSAVVALGIWLGWRIYGRKPARSGADVDPLEISQPGVFAWLRDKVYIDELYEKTVVRFNAWGACACDWIDREIWGRIVDWLARITLFLANIICAAFDEYLVNGGFDESCRGVRKGGGFFSRLQDGQTQTYLRVLGVALTALVLLLTWGCGK